MRTRYREVSICLRELLELLELNFAEPSANLFNGFAHLTFGRHAVGLLVVPTGHGFRELVLAVRDHHPPRLRINTTAGDLTTDRKPVVGCGWPWPLPRPHVLGLVRLLRP
jgi:hypothetical protein